jgi:glycosyltransferase 2 family protein
LAIAEAQAVKCLFSLWSSWRRPLYYLGIGLGVSLFLWQMWQGGQAVYQKALQLDQPLFLLVATGVTFIAYTLQMIGWGQIMQGLGALIDLPSIFRGYTLAFLPRYIPGTIWGYLSRGAWLKSNYRISYLTSSTGSVLEASLFLITAGVISVAYLVWHSWHGALRLMIIPAVLLPPWLMWYGLKIISALFVPRRSKAMVTVVKQTVDLYNWLGAYMIYLTMWGFHGLSLVLLLKAFGLEQSPNVFETSFIFSLSWLAGFAVVIVPSGLGVREFALSGLLAAQFALLTEAASVIAVTSRLTIYLAEIAWLVLGLRLTQTHVRVSQN